MKIVIAGATAFCVLLIGLAIFLSVHSSTSSGARIIPMDVAYENRVRDGGWVKGSTTPTVTVIEYSDLQCPACALVQENIDRAVTETSDYTQLVFRNYPLPMHNKAKQAARAAEAAGRQGKFWEMKQIIYTNQKDWTDKTASQFKGDLEEYAKSLSLNMEQFKNDVSDTGSIDEQINKDMNEGNKIPLEGTPTILINGTKLDHIPQTKEEFITLITEAKAKATPAPASSASPTPAS